MRNILERKNPSLHMFIVGLIDCMVLYFAFQSIDPPPNPCGSRVRNTLGAMAGIIVGICLAGPYGAVIGGILGTGAEAWQKT